MNRGWRWRWDAGTWQVGGAGPGRLQLPAEGPWACCLPTQAASQAQPSDSAQEAGTVARPAPGLARWPRQPPAVLRGPGHTWAPRPPANSSEHGEGCRHRLTHTKKSRDSTGGKGTRGPGARAAHLAPAQDPGTAGEAASVDLPALAAGWRPPPGSSHSLPLARRLGQGLSCSGPWCPPPAPAYRGAAAAVPAHPSPGPSGSAGAGRRLRRAPGPHTVPAARA